MGIKELFSEKNIAIYLAVVDTAIFGLKKAQDIQKGDFETIEEFVRRKTGDFQVSNIVLKKDEGDVDLMPENVNFMKTMKDKKENKVEVKK